MNIILLKDFSDNLKALTPAFTFIVCVRCACTQPVPRAIGIREVAVLVRLQVVETDAEESGFIFTSFLTVIDLLTGQCFSVSSSKIEVVDAFDPFAVGLHS
jgi:hypothetical protein